jgi:hypothetical protein
VAWIAAQQHGVVDHRQLLRVGVTRSGVDRRVAAGWLHRKHLGVFAVGHPALTPHGEWMAAVLACGSDAVLSHQSAAALWGLAGDGAIPSVTVPGRRRRGPATIEVHTGSLRPDETVIFDHIRVTSVGRTLLDLGEVMTVAELVRCIDNATNARRIGRTTMPSVIKGARGRRGLKALKQALLMTRPEDVLTRSDPERDTRKTNNLMARGWTVLRFTWRQVVNDPAWVVQSLQAVRSRAACPGSPSSSA